jgi:predicted mannosyl-3-phosphoglycerate phosphatase (HAD superfamily)
MENRTENKSGTIFLDIDGTLVYHNYEPDIIIDRFIPNTLTWVKERVKEGFIVMLTTSRSGAHAQKVQKMLADEGVNAFLIAGLGTGMRVVVNDAKEGDALKAISINCNRDKGVFNV